MEEEYIEHIKSIVDALGIEKEPVGVKYMDEKPGAENRRGKLYRVWSDTGGI